MAVKEVQTEATPGYTRVELLTLKGPEFREVSTAPPRQASREEIPVIDLTNIRGSLGQKKKLAAEVKAACEGSGFFYIKNHGIPQSVISGAHEHSKTFFSQSKEDKRKVGAKFSKFENGFGESGSTQINQSESRDTKEIFAWRYDPELDPDNHGNPEAVQAGMPFKRGEDFVWEKTAHLNGFKDASIAYWQHCLSLARDIVRIFALALDLPENYFDNVMTHPGADGMYIHYPGTPKEVPREKADVGIGSHTDIQCVTLLWQDMSGGLQVLSAKNEWLEATPIEGTFVVNIGDFLQRLSNNKFHSTVHRVYNLQEASRYSMPFFLGFNYDSVCSVVPTCVDENNPALFEPISCGQWYEDRIELANYKESKKA